MRVSAYPDLSALRLTREIKERGYGGAYTAVKRYLAAIRPERQPKPFEVRFETPAGYQAQVEDGVIRLSAAQLSALLEGLDWRRVHQMRHTRVPVAAG